MARADFVHLRVHSAYSLAEGAIQPDELVSLARKNAMPAVAITDSNNLFGALEFSLIAAKQGVQPVVGCQLMMKPFVPPAAAADLPPTAAAVQAAGGGKPAAEEEYHQLVLLAQNDAGYRNLSKLSSMAFLDVEASEKPHLSWQQIEGLTEGLICLTGGAKGVLGRLVLQGKESDAYQCLKHLQTLFPDRLYLELQRHGLAEEERTEERFLFWAYQDNIPIVATNDCFFATPDMYRAHDAFLCISEGSYVSETNRRKVTPEHYFKSPDEMRNLFKDLPEAIENTINIATRCSLLLQVVSPMLPPFPTADGRSEGDELRHQATQGLRWRLEKYVFPASGSESITDSHGGETAREKICRQYEERLDFELGVIIKMGFAGYFLICADFIQWAKRNDIPVGPGRGSGAGSIVAWAMQITDLDPIRFNLLFERFLNPERVSMPDFDIDFCQERRDEVIDYVQQRYGRDRVAQIITFGKLQARAVVRDVGRVLQMPYGQVDRIAKLIPQNPANPVSLEEALDREPALREARDSDDAVARLINVALKLEGLYRHASTHAAGIVIGDRPLEQLVPLYRDPKSSIPATQFNMKYVEQAGLVKFDFLGLKTLTVIKKTADLIEQTTGVRIDPSTIPLDDKKTFTMLARGECVGVFQLEGAGMRDLCRQMQVHEFEQISAIVALFRPGPMDNIPKYIACLKGTEERDYMHPLLEPVLKDTYSVMIYQEQVMQAAQVLAGYTLAGADQLRRAMGKKIKEEMDAQRDSFVKGARDTNNVPPEQAGLIFDQIAKFAGYGFNRAHSAAYALIAYQTAWLKANYPVEFMAATMTLDMNSTDKLASLKQEVQRLEIPLLPPDINASHEIFSVEIAQDGTKCLRYALAALKGVGEQAMKFVVAEREAGGPFQSLFDFARRIDARTMNKRQMEALAAAGAFDRLNPNRAQVFEASEMLLRFSSALTQEKESGQSSLFGDAAAAQAPLPDLPKVDNWDELERLKKEFEAVGFYLSAHPLDRMRGVLKRMMVTPLGAVAQKLADSPSTRIRIAGVVLKKQERTSAKGNRFAFVQMSDPDGVYEVTLFSEVLAQSRALLEPGKALILTLDAEAQEDESFKFLAQHIEDLDKKASEAVQVLDIVVQEAPSVPALKTLLDRTPGGRTKVQIVVPVEGHGDCLLSIPGGWQITPDTRKAIRAIPGVQSVRDN